MNKGLLYFDDFMEQSLYDPLNGYYQSPHSVIGRQGDFTTAVEESPYVAFALANLYLHIRKQYDDMEIVEFGGGNLSLAKNFITYCEGKDISPKYHVIEKTTARKTWQEQKGITRTALDEYSHDPEQPVLIILHEIIDAFCAKRGRVQDGGVAEIAMQFDGESDYWSRVCVNPSAELSDYFQTLQHNVNLTFTEGQHFEARPALTSQLKNMFDGFNNAVVVVIDYGYHDKEYYSPERMDGTLTCYKQHSIIPHDNLKFGDCDISVHVDFSQLARVLKKINFETEFWLSQGDWLMSLISDAEVTATVGENIGQKKHLYRLLSPFDLGGMFKVHISSKNMDVSSLSFLGNYDRSGLLWN